MLITLLGCEKLLTEKSDEKLVVISSLDHLQSLLDNVNEINKKVIPNDPEHSADNHYITDATYNGYPEFQRNKYTWKENMYSANPAGSDWFGVYKIVYYTNSVLENLKRFPRTESNRYQWDNIRGQALALRGFQFLNAVTAWAKVYNASSADKDLGIPLRLNDNFNEASVRSTMSEVFNQIIQDLESAVSLLPNDNVAFTRASKPFAYSMLARSYLYMGEYTKAKLYADSALHISPVLLDYNTLKEDNLLIPRDPIVLRKNREIIYWGATFTPILQDPKTLIDSVLYASYHSDDLRKTYFFKPNTNGSFYSAGSYSGDSSPFGGVAASELYLTRSECLARAGMVDEAMSDLNNLMRNRWDKSKIFTPYTASSKEDALQVVLTERRKELIFRGLRWFDIKRLNRDGANIVLKRVVNGETFILEPNSNRYALPIPDDVIELSGMEQNPK